MSAKGSIGTRKLHQARSSDGQASLFKAADDLADHVFSDCIGLDDGKGAFNSHLNSVTVDLMGCKAAKDS